MEKFKNIPVGRTKDIVVQTMGDETLIYDLRIDKAFCLNPTSALVWQHSNGKNTVEMIAQNLGAILKQKITDDVVWLALDQLKKEDLLVNESSEELNFNGFNRREALKRIGISTMVALPMISMILSPEAAHAASGCIDDSQPCSPAGIPCCCGTCTGSDLCCTDS